MPLSVLFVHNNFPAQFGFVAEALVERGDRVVSIGDANARGVPGVPIARWQAKRGSTAGLFDLAVRAEADLIRGRAAADAAMVLKAKGFLPDVIVGHPGWGETILLGEIFPAARRIEYAEFFYRAKGGDVGFDPEFSRETQDALFKVFAKNATMALALAEADRIVAPTGFQAGMLPAGFRRDVRIIHEGIDTGAISPDPEARLTLPDGRVLDRRTPVVTFINRRFEPLRGAHVFFRALPDFLAAVPEAHVVMIGADARGGYGLPPPEGKTWKQIFWAEIADRVDASRVHFLGTVPHPVMLSAVAIGAAHVYFTYPFVPSWSLFESMASEALVIASDTAPVRDLVKHGENGILIDFFDVEGLSAALVEACRRPEAYRDLRKAARRTILSGYDRKLHALPAWLDLIDEIAALGPR